MSDCLRWPPKAAIISSTETNVPAKVPRNSPYLNVSFKPRIIASLLENSSGFLIEPNKKKRLKQSDPMISELAHASEEKYVRAK